MFDGGEMRRIHQGRIPINPQSIFNDVGFFMVTSQPKLDHKIHNQMLASQEGLRPNLDRLKLSQPIPTSLEIVRTHI